MISGCRAALPGSGWSRGIGRSPRKARCDSAGRPQYSPLAKRGIVRLTPAPLLALQFPEIEDAVFHPEILPHGDAALNAARGLSISAPARSQQADANRDPVPKTPMMLEARRRANLVGAAEMAPKYFWLSSVATLGYGEAIPT